MSGHLKDDLPISPTLQLLPIDHITDDLKWQYLRLWSDWIWTMSPDLEIYMVGLYVYLSLSLHMITAVVTACVSVWTMTLESVGSRSRSRD